MNSGQHQKIFVYGSSKWLLACVCILIFRKSITYQHGRKLHRTIMINDNWIFSGLLFCCCLGVLWLWNNLHQVFQVGWQPKIIDDLLMWASPRFYSGFCKTGCEVTWFKNMWLIQYCYNLSTWLKFVFSKKATKIDKIFIIDLTLTT